MSTRVARAALVTGCSSGIGAAAARALQAAGFVVCATARDVGSLEQLGGQGCRTLALDVNPAGGVALPRAFAAGGW